MMVFVHVVPFKYNLLNGLSLSNECARASRWQEPGIGLGITAAHGARISYFHSLVGARPARHVGSW